MPLFNLIFFGAPGLVLSWVKLTQWVHMKSRMQTKQLLCNLVLLAQFPESVAGEFSSSTWPGPSRWGLHCTALHCLHCTALHFTTLHCTVLQYTALHCTALHCTAVSITAFFTPLIPGRTLRKSRPRPLLQHGPVSQRWDASCCKKCVCYNFSVNHSIIFELLSCGMNFTFICLNFSFWEKTTCIYFFYFLSFNIFEMK